MSPSINAMPESRLRQKATFLKNSFFRMFIFYGDVEE